MPYQLTCWCPTNFPHLHSACILVSPASLLDSQHGCITSPHAKKESGQTPYAVFLGPGSGFDCCGVWFYSSLLMVQPHLLTVQDQIAYGV